MSKKKRSALYNAINRGKPIEVLWHPSAMIPKSLLKPHITLGFAKNWSDHGAVLEIKKSKGV